MESNDSYVYIAATRCIFWTVKPEHRAYEESFYVLPGSVLLKLPYKNYFLSPDGKICVPSVGAANEMIRAGVTRHIPW